MSRLIIVTRHDYMPSTGIKIFVSCVIATVIFCQFWQYFLSIDARLCLAFTHNRTYDARQGVSRPKTAGNRDG